MMHFSQMIIAPIKHIYHKGLDIIFPPRCLVCNVLTSQVGALCAECWQGMMFNSPPSCAVCSYPFEYDPGEGALCGICIGAMPPYARAHTVFHYDDNSRKLIHGFKYGDKTHMAPYLAAWMVRVGKHSLREADMLVPVPVHKYRLLKRRYNQAALLAIAMGRLCHLPVYADCLKRVKYTSYQARLSLKERARNIQGVFKLNPHYRTILHNKHIVLIDDVMTTGATASACSKILLKAGAKKVSVITLARTIKK